jgi:hypothetical protein
VLVGRIPCRLLLMHVLPRVDRYGVTGRDTPPRCDDTFAWAGRPSVAADVDRPSGGGQTTRVRPGWTLPVTALGAITGVVGLVVRNGAAGGHAACQFIAQFQSFNQALTKSVGRLPSQPSLSGAPAGCASFDLRYNLGLAIALLGAAIVLVGFACLMRRSRHASAASTPWPIRRSFDTAALWLDRRIPGHGVNAKPRVRGGFLAVLATVALVLAASAGVAGWQHYRSSEQTAAYLSADRALPTITLPATIEREPSASCGEEVCGRSRLNPPQLEHALAALVHGKPNSFLTDLLACAGPCPVTIYGHYDGEIAIAIAFWHLGVTRNGHVPKGATPARAGLTPRPGHPYGYFRGSNITVELADPDPSD